VLGSSLASFGAQAECGAGSVFTAVRMEAAGRMRPSSWRHCARGRGAARSRGPGRGRGVSGRGHSAACRLWGGLALALGVPALRRPSKPAKGSAGLPWLAAPGAGPTDIAEYTPEGFTRLGGADTSGQAARDEL
jgi:hypothetical protein